MPDHDLCGVCGAERPVDAPRGLCPGCLLRQALKGEASTLNLPRAVAVDAMSLGSSAPGVGVSETITATIGAVPRDTLRDTLSKGADGSLGWPVDEADVDRSIRYQVFGEIARGGMGAILKGRDLVLGRDVALKVLRYELSGVPDMVHRFIEEARIGGQLQHPGVVPIYGMGRFADGRPFFSMKLVKGNTLATMLEGRTSPTADHVRFLGVFESICQTMASAHSRGVIHRDLKPSNVMVGSFGEVLVMDWGLAKVLSKGGDGGSSTDSANTTNVASDPIAPNATIVSTGRSGSRDVALSQPGSALGTPGYMAPEQARGEIDNLDERADVFALGSILCEILTGFPAFTGRDSEEIQHKAARGESADALARMAICGADDELIALAKNCLAAEPEDRPEDAASVVRRISAYRAGVQDRLHQVELDRAAEEARAEEAISRVKVERDRRRLTIALAATVLISSAVGGGALVWYTQRRAVRSALAIRKLDEALGEARLRLSQARAAPEAEFEPWIKAIEIAKRVDGLLLGGGLSAGDRARARAVVRPIQDEGAAAGLRIAQARADCKMIKRAEVIRLSYSKGASWLNDQYRDAFLEYGIDPVTLTVEDAGRRVASRKIVVELATILDLWALVLKDSDEAGARKLIEVALIADDDPWRRRLHEAIWANDRARLSTLADSIDLTVAPRTSAVSLAVFLGRLGEGGKASVVLRKLQMLYPEDFWTACNLSRILHANSEIGDTDALRFATVAVAIRPDNALARSNYATILREIGDLEGAIGEYRAAIRCKPDYVSAYEKLIRLLVDQGRREEATAVFRDALPHSTSGDARSQIALGKMLRALGEHDGAIARFHEAVELEPGDDVAFVCLAREFYAKGEYDRSIAEARKALRINPGNADAHLSAGKALEANNEIGRAIAEFREALRLDPNQNESRRRLEPLEDPGRVGRIVADQERLRDAEDGYNLASFCYKQARYTDAARLLARAIEADPVLASRLDLRHRYNAARSAALAGGGKQEVEPKPAEAAMTAFRRQALEWLRADLADWTKVVSTTDSVNKLWAVKTLARWKTDSAFASVRTPSRLAKLPDEEQNDWRALWVEVDAVLRQARGDRH